MGKENVLYMCMLNHFRCGQLCELMECSLLGSLCMEFSRQEDWSGLPCPPPEDIPKPGIEPMSPAPPALQVDSLPLRHQGSPAVCVCVYIERYIMQP